MPYALFFHALCNLVIFREVEGFKNWNYLRDLFTRFIYEIYLRDLFKRSFYEIYLRDLLTQDVPSFWVTL